MKDIRQNKQFRVYVWQVFNATMAFLIATIPTIKLEYAAILVAILIPLLNQITKYVNMKYFSDFGVK